MVDVGGASFVHLVNYMVENRAFEAIAEAGVTPTVHSVVVGGQPMVDTLEGFRAVADAVPAVCDFIVWENEVHGPVRTEKGTAFQEMTVYTERADRVLGVIRLAERDSDTFRADLNDMLSRRLTFAEALDGSNFRVMSRSRLKIIWEEYQAQMGHGSLMEPQKLVEEVFAKTRVRIAEDDPVLSVVLLNEALVTGLCERIEGSVRASEGRVNAAVLQQTALAKQALADTVSAGAEHLAAEVPARRDLSGRCAEGGGGRARRGGVASGRPGPPLHVDCRVGGRSAGRVAHWNYGGGAADSPFLTVRRFHRRRRSFVASTRWSRSHCSSSIETLKGRQRAFGMSSSGPGDCPSPALSAISPPAPALPFGLVWPAIGGEVAD